MVVHGLHLDISTCSVSIEAVSTLGTNFVQRDRIRISSGCCNFLDFALCYRRRNRFTLQILRFTQISLTGTKVLTSFPLLLTIIPCIFTIIWPYEKKLSNQWSVFNSKLFKRIIAALGLTGSIVTLVLLAKIVKEENPSEFIEQIGHSPFTPSTTGFIIFTLVVTIAYSSSNWLNFVSTSVEDKIRGRDSYDLSQIDEKSSYQLQFYPIFAITGPIRILITYGIWQYMRNYLVRTDQFTNLSPSWIEINADCSARLETWFNLAGLVFFVSSILLEWLSYICVQSKMSISFWFGNLAGLAACPIVLGKS